MLLIKRSCIAVLIMLVCSVVGQGDLRYDYRYNFPVEEYGQRQGAVPPANIGSLAGNLIPPSSVLPNVGPLGGGPRPASFAAPSAPASYAAYSTPAPYTAPPTAAPYTAPPTPAPYTAPPTSAPYTTSSTPSPYATSSTPAPYATSSTPAPYATSSTPAPYAAYSTPVPYTTSSTSAPYATSSTRAPYTIPSTYVPSIPIRPISYKVPKKPSAPNTLAVALLLNATVSEYYQPHYSGPVRKPYSGSDSYRTTQRPN